MFASWSLVNKLGVNFLGQSFNLTKCRSISMCFVLSWNTWMWRVVWLSQCIIICWISQNLSSWRKCFIHTSSQVSDLIGFNTWLSNYILFLAFPRNNISSNENTISSSGMFVYRRPFPIILTISWYLGTSFILIK